MNADEWCLWFAICWAVFLAYAAVDAPSLFARLADRIRHGGGPR